MDIGPNIVSIDMIAVQMLLVERRNARKKPVLDLGLMILVGFVLYFIGPQEHCQLAVGKMLTHTPGKYATQIEDGQHPLHLGRQPADILDAVIRGKAVELGQALYKIAMGIGVHYPERRFRWINSRETTAGVTPGIRAA